MNLEQYKILFPNERVWRTTLTDANGNSAVIVEGMLQFDDTADIFAGPFEGGYAHFALTDHRNLPGPYGSVQLVAWHLERFRMSHWNFPLGVYKEPAENEAHLQRRLAKLSPKELRAWEARVAACHIETTTVEFPFALKLSGNDDSTYTKFYPTLEDANHDLQLMLDMQPCNFQLHVDENGFVFTN